MPYPDYQEPTLEQAQSSTDYTGQVALIDQQNALNQKTYAQRRQDTINSYQSSLDSINLGLREAGIQSRGQYSDRNLYDASGQVSGIGQAVGAANVAPYLGQIKNLQGQHESNLTGLANAEAQSALDIQNQKYQSLQKVLSNLRNAAKERYNIGKQKYDTEQEALRYAEQQRLQAEQTAYSRQQDEYEKAQEEISKQESGRSAITNTRQDQQEKGRRYIATIKDLQDTVRKYGADAIVTIGKDKFLLSQDELLSLENTRSQIRNREKLKSTSTKPTQAEIDRNNKQLYNTDLNKFSGVVQTRSGGQGSITREQIIDALSQDHPWKSRADITKEVYAAYPDTYR